MICESSFSTAVDECVSAPCHLNAFCLNTETVVGYECLCNGTGFTGDGTNACDGEWDTIIIIIPHECWLTMCKDVLIFDAHTYVKRTPKLIFCNYY